MLNSRKVAVTGGISSGKSRLCACLKELGAYVVSADNIVHQQLSPHTPLGKQVIGLLGDEVLKNQGIDREVIASKVFKDPCLLRSLEKIIHPEVFLEIQKEFVRAQNQSFKLFVAEIPLLFETGAENFFDLTIAVVAREEECINRFTQTTGYSSEEYERRMSQQLPAREKALMADFVIFNDGSEEDLKQEAEKIFEKLIVDSNNSFR